MLTNEILTGFRWDKEASDAVEEARNKLQEKQMQPWLGSSTREDHSKIAEEAKALLKGRKAWKGTRAEEQEKLAAAV
jgi:hypothetical protein